MECEPYRDHVILLHGIGRSWRVMARMAEFLEDHNFCAHNIGYHSTRYPIEELSQLIWDKIKTLTNDKSRRIHFVGHSLGGIITRYLLQHHIIENLGRVVLLASPNHGSEVVDFLKNFRFYRYLFGPSGQQLHTINNQLLQSLPSHTNYEIGVIAGDRSVDKLFSWFLLPGLNDGKVTVKSAQLDGMKDFIIVHYSHPFLPQKSEVIQQTAFFLKNGRFQH